LAVDADLAKFFDTVEHDVLMARVSRKVRDKRVLKLIGKYLRAGVMINGRLNETRRGVPQGGPLSPLLSNILLDDLDKELEGRNHRFARYADDFVILVKSRRAGERVMASITRFLEQKLKLKVNQEKSKVAHTNEITFLGFAFSGAKIRWSDKAFAKFKRRLKELTGRSWGVSMEFRFAKLTVYLRGWMGYFGISEHYAPIPEIDHWLRRRVRMCYWKQWRYCRTKVRELTKRHESKRSLETLPHVGHPIRHDQSMAQVSRSAICQRSMGKHPLPRYGSVALGNRLVRTRTPGGVGAGGEIPPATRLAW